MRLVTLERLHNLPHGVEARPEIRPDLLERRDQLGQGLGLLADWTSSERIGPQLTRGLSQCVKRLEHPLG